jgi:hypothetical protein
MGDVIELSELRRPADPSGGPASPEGMPGDHGACECPDCGGDVLTFPPVELLPADELAARVPAVPLVRDVRRLAAWAGVREVTVDGFPLPADAAEATAELGVPADRLRLLWIVAVNTGLVQITRSGASPGRGFPDDMLEFWDGVVMDVLDRTDDGLTGSPVVDEHVTEMLATMYAMSEGITLPALAEGMLQAHEIGCEADPAQMRRLRTELPRDLRSAAGLLEYCGLFERHAGGVRLTPLGVWAVRQDLLREGHDAPLLADVAGYAHLPAAELVDAMLSGEAPSSAATLWLDLREPDDAARELIKVAASGTAGQRGVVGTLLEELGPEAEPAVREALAEPMMRRHAVVWLGVRDLPAPALSEHDSTWLAVDSLATLLHIDDVPAAMDQFEALEVGEGLLRLIDVMSGSDHPDALGVLDLLGGHHPDAGVAKAARKAAMKARSR